MPLAEKGRALRAAVEQDLLRSYPLVVFARLPRIAPALLLAIAGLVLLGGVLSTPREPEDAGTLIAAPATRHEYLALARRLERLDEGHRRLTRTDRVRARADVRRMMRLAQGPGLRRCLPASGSRLRATMVLCDGRRVDDTAVIIVFFIALGAAAMAVQLWLTDQLRASWMLPRWSPSLWYTPVYAALGALLTGGPFLMTSLYFHRAEAGDGIPADGFGFGRPSLLLYLVLLLQATAVVVHIVMSHASERPARRDGSGVLSDAVQRASEDYSRLWALTRCLVPAWLVLLFGGLLPSGDLIGSAVTLAGYAACALAVLWSGTAELELARHVHATSEGRVSTSSRKPNSR